MDHIVDSPVSVEEVQKALLAIAKIGKSISEMLLKLEDMEQAIESLKAIDDGTRGVLLYAKPEKGV